MDDRLHVRVQSSSGPLAEETPRREAVRTLGAAGAALLGALGMGAMSSDAEVQAKGKGKGKRIGSEKKGKKGKKGKRGPEGPAGPAGPQGPRGQSAGTTYWARVDSDGRFIAGHGFVRAHYLGKAGQYTVSTAGGTESFESCGMTGMAERFKFISFGSTQNGTVGIQVSTFVNDPAAFISADGAFSIAVICPAE